jgi:hypothetical protein
MLFQIATITFVFFYTTLRFTDFSKYRIVPLIIEGYSPHGQFNYQGSPKEELLTGQLIYRVDIDKE